MCHSEVARLRRMIEEEHQAGQRALHDLAMTGRHAFIEARMQSMGEHFQALVNRVGCEQASAIMCEALEHREEVKRDTEEQ